MHKKLSLSMVGLLAGATIATSASPAHAQECDAKDPVLDHVCDTVESVGPWVGYYYNEVGEAWYRVYCLLWDPTC
ncbi:MAG TPA: hypothetical protein VG318_11535 [Actinomycetota bacterium]|nr:hypothetical protein [Actinomycetota bacterium]